MLAIYFWYDFWSQMILLWNEEMFTNHIPLSSTKIFPSVKILFFYTLTHHYLYHANLQSYTNQHVCFLHSLIDLIWEIWSFRFHFPTWYIRQKGWFHNLISSFYLVATFLEHLLRWAVQSLWLKYNCMPKVEHFC